MMVENSVIKTVIYCSLFFSNFEKSSNEIASIKKKNKKNKKSILLFT